CYSLDSVPLSPYVCLFLSAPIPPAFPSFPTRRSSDLLLDTFCDAVIRATENRSTNYDNLVINLIPKKYIIFDQGIYRALMAVAQFVAGLTDGNALLIYNKINAKVV